MTLENENNLSVEEEAALWTARLSDGPLSGAQEKAFVAWVKRSPRHEQEIRALASFWDGLDRMLAEDQLKAVRSGGFVRRNLPRLAQVAAVALVVFGFFSVYQGSEAPTEDAGFEAQYSASIGNNKEVTLPDGSSAFLNTDSQIDVMYSETSRTIRLVKGEVLFDVTPNKNRPFVVLARTGVVRAVGTVFTVRLVENKVAVMVTEGRVELSSLSLPGSVLDDPDSISVQPKTLMSLEAGQTASFSDKIEAVSQIDADMIEKRLAWRDALLIFDGESLGDVIGDVSRYTPDKIIITSPELEELAISGVFPTGETSALIHTLEQSFGVSARYSADGTIYLSYARN